jgi:hypothetical protein
MKKLVTAALTATLLAGPAFSAVAAPVRNGVDLDDAEGAVGTVLVAALVAIVGTAAILAIESGENNEAPTSA